MSREPRGEYSRDEVFQIAEYQLLSQSDYQLERKTLSKPQSFFKNLQVHPQNNATQKTALKHFDTLTCSL
jgi:hypothetical protein